jgi:hypothetical protein
MTSKIRLTQRRELLRLARGRARQKIKESITPVFERQHKRLERFLRRSNLRKRLNKIDLPGLDNIDGCLYEKRYRIEGDGPYRVVNIETGETVPGGEHKEKGKALAHLRALYANVEDVKMDGDLALLKVQELFKGGKGSGNFGHKGRPGEVGGSGVH